MQRNEFRSPVTRTTFIVHTWRAGGVSKAANLQNLVSPGGLKRGLPWMQPCGSLLMDVGKLCNLCVFVVE